MEKIPFDLAILAQATNYQRWTLELALPFLGNRILEVGAGIGNMSQWLPVREKLILTEADVHLIPHLQDKLIKAGKTGPQVEVNHTEVTPDWQDKFKEFNLDTIVSFNVLEHIEDDLMAMQSFAQILQQSRSNRPKRVVTFVPAHSWAYGSIDSAYGHFRRYGIDDIRKIQNKLFPQAKLHYQFVNVFGLPGWFLMGRLLNKTSIELGAVQSFERLCPWIKGVDNFLHGPLKIPFGQSLLFVIELT